MAARRPFPRAAGWRRVLLVTTSAGLVTAMAAVAAAALFSGGAAAASAGIGAGAVTGFSFLSLALIDWADRRAPQLAIPLFMAGFVLKVAALAILLPLVRPGEWLQPGWVLGSAVAVFLMWQLAEILSFSQMRLSVNPES